MMTARFLHVRIDDLLTIYPITGLTRFKIVNILMCVMYNVIYIKYILFTGINITHAFI